MKNLQMKKKLLISFGSIILMSTVIVIFLLAAIHNVSSSIGRMYNGPYENVNDVWVLRRNLIDIQRAINRAMAEDETGFDDEAFETLLKTVEKDVEEVKQSIAFLETQVQQEDNKQRVSKIVEAVNEGEQIRPQVMELLRLKKMGEAYDLNYNKYMPVVSEINTMAVDLYDALTEDAQEFVEKAEGVSAWSVTIGIILLAVGIIYGIIMLIRISDLVAKPIKEITTAAEEMQKGNMNAAGMITYVSKDEVGILAECMRGTMRNLDDYVKEISQLLVHISGGDLTVNSDEITDFLGDFASIKESLVFILKRFNTTLTEINHLSRNVDGSASQIADAAQNLAAGSTEQAGTLEHLVTTIATISHQVSVNAENANQAKGESVSTEEQVTVCKEQMERMMNAMRDINEASSEIGKIIKTIEDIAFQTNILALNAAVEAARAGEAGKGFAVVADEVRNLASKSADASKDTAQLIEKCVGAVNNGSLLAQETSETLLAVVDKVENVKTLIGHIAKQSEDQAAAISQVRTGVEQVSSVVHTNSATAEESAATSEELSSQAERLDKLVQRFKLFEG